MEKEKNNKPAEGGVVENAQIISTKEICESALETKRKLNQALELDLMLLRLEQKLDELNERAKEWYL